MRSDSIRWRASRQGGHLRKRIRPSSLPGSRVTLMVWSAAGTLLGDSPPGNESSRASATPPAALLGERRAAPPGTRLKEDFCLRPRAARVANINPRTLYRWMKDPEFDAAYSPRSSQTAHC